MALHGIDIASYQSNMNVKNVTADFVIIKATGGTGYVNPSCDKHFQQAKSSGKLIGVYHYANEKGYEGTAKQEANHFLKNTKNYLKGDAIPVLDWEATNKGNIQWALDWLNEVEKQTGIKPWFYTYTDVLDTYNFKPIAKNDNALWVARYPDMATHRGYIKNKKPPKTSGFSNGPAAYQYSSTTIIPGYSSPVDVDIFYGSKTAWKNYAAPGGKAKKKKYYTNKDTPAIFEALKDLPVYNKPGFNDKTKSWSMIKQGSRLRGEKVEKSPNGYNRIKVATGGYVWGSDEALKKL